MRVLCVAEKPSQAKAIVQILGQGQQRTRDGTSMYNKNYDFDYRISGTFVQATMSSVSGHVRGLDFPDSMRAWYSCNPIDLFTADVIKSVDKDNQKVAQNIEREARTASHLYIWTDCDREGEGIGGEIAELCRAVNPRIVVKRAHFSSVLPQEIHGAMQNPRDLDMRQVDAVEARTELDLRIGSALTRYQTLRLSSRFAALDKKLLSYGPCQFPTLGFVVDQFLRVESFVPEPFWFIFMDHVKEDGHATFTWRRTRLFDQEVCYALYARCMAAPVMVRITAVRSRPKEKWRPLPLTTVELQKCCARYLRMAPDVIMNVAESLYNNGFISYPRTETDQFDTGMDLRGIVTKLVQHPPLAEYATRLVDGAFCWPRRGSNNDKAHPPIHPVAAANNLTGDAKRLYDFVARRFLACCSDNAKGQATEVDAVVGSEQFAAKGLMVVARNYLDVYPFERWSESTVPVYTQGDEFVPTTLEMRTGTTTAPKLLSYADLVDIMDKNGIGTDATHADHIKKIIDREYIFKTNENTLTPSTLGIGLVEGYDAVGLELSLTKPYLRRATERDLGLICQGAKTKDAVISEGVRLYRAVYEKSIADIAKLEDALSRCLQEQPGGGAVWVPPAEGSGGTGGARVCSCPGCASGNLSLRTRKNGGWMIGCSLYPQCRRVIWVPEIVLEIGVGSDTCRSCVTNAAGPAKLLDIRFRPGSVPPGVPLLYQGCIRGCDDLINEFFNVRAASTTTADQQHSNRGSSLLVSRRSSPSPQHTLVQASPTPLFHGNQEAVALSGNPACRCGVPSAQRVTAADGPNRGRPFYVCSKARESQCGFFEWADQQQPPQQQPLQNRRQEMPLYGQQPLPSVYSSTDDGASPVAKPKCKCGYFAAIKTKQAGGANQGREYYMCTRAFNGCGFVCWADEAEAYMARPPGASGSAAPTASTCYSCGQSGHWARDCPHGAQASGASSASFLSRPPERPAPSAPARRGRASRGGGARARTRRGGSARGRGSRSSGRGRGAALSSGIGGSGGPGFMDTVDHSSGGGGFDFWS